MKGTPNVTEIVDLEAAENCVKIEQVNFNFLITFIKVKNICLIIFSSFEFETFLYFLSFFFKQKKFHFFFNFDIWLKNSTCFAFIFDAPSGYDKVQKKRCLYIFK